MSDTSPNKKLLRFLIAAFAAYILWYIVYDLYLKPDGRLDTWLNYAVALHSTWILKLTGYTADVIPGIQQFIVRIDNTDMVGVGNPCNGMELFALFAGFVICFPGAVKNKLWYIPAGLLIIHVVNVIRAAALALNQKHYPASLDFNHHYTFTILVYALIFGLWMFWVNKYSGISFKPEKAE